MYSSLSMGQESASRQKTLIECGFCRESKASNLKQRVYRLPSIKMRGEFNSGRFRSRPRLSPRAERTQFCTSQPGTPSLRATSAAVSPFSTSKTALSLKDFSNTCFFKTLMSDDVTNPPPSKTPNMPGQPRAPYIPTYTLTRKPDIHLGRVFQSLLSGIKRDQPDLGG